LSVVFEWCERAVRYETFNVVYSGAEGDIMDLKMQ
jgi:hypothetical protein